MMDIKKLYERWCRLIDKTGALFQYLNSGSFFSDPGSIRHHHATVGGLAEHTLGVLGHALHLSLVWSPEATPMSIFRAALFHDFCKVGTYKPIQKWRKDAQNRWEAYDGWDHEDPPAPLGHGELSIIRALKFCTLTAPEMLAIRWHMGAFDATPGYGLSALSASNALHPLVLLVQTADQLDSTGVLGFAIHEQNIGRISESLDIEEREQTE